EAQKVPALQWLSRGDRTSEEPVIRSLSPFFSSLEVQRSANSSPAPSVAASKSTTAAFSLRKFSEKVYVFRKDESFNKMCKLYEKNYFTKTVSCSQRCKFYERNYFTKCPPTLYHCACVSDMINMLVLGTYYVAVIENCTNFVGHVVVDVGASSGILSLFAAQVGAKHVYAMEASEMAKYARKLIAGNLLLAQRITVVKGKIEEVELPKKADILISKPMGIRVGAAYYGFRPVVEFVTFNFSMQAIDHIINFAAKSNYMSADQVNVPIVFWGPNGAAAGVGAQHSRYAWYGACPGLKVLAPYLSEDARGLLKAAIRDVDPIVLLENELLYGESFPISVEVLDSSFCLPIGKAKVEREGKDVTITTFSRMVGYAIKVSNNEEGVALEIFTRSLMMTPGVCVRNLGVFMVGNEEVKVSWLELFEEGFLCGEAESSHILQEARYRAKCEARTGMGPNIPLPYLDRSNHVQTPRQSI
ncbi:hypothetical protein LOK49_LG02G02637, partial [Camellia lanceoleosa]